jgi:hypothetical protein
LINWTIIKFSDAAFRFATPYPIKMPPRAGGHAREPLGFWFASTFFSILLFVLIIRTRRSRNQKE